MSSSCLSRFIVGTLFALGANVGWSEYYPDRAESDRTDITIHIIWLKNYAEVSRACSELEGIYPPKSIIYGCYFRMANTIYAVQPESFNDYEHLVILGHEFWHALGAEHP